MKSLVILAAVLLFSQAAKVPQEVTQHVAVTLPTTPSQEVPAHVVEVTKNQKPITHKTPVMHSVMTTMQPEAETTMTNEMETTSITPSKVVTHMPRKTRAVPFKDNDKMTPQLTTDINKIKAILAQNKLNKRNQMPLQRSMRSLPVEMKTEKSSTDITSTQNPVITPVDGPMSTIDPCDLLCTKFEFDPICATNGVCLHEFPNQCILDTYNCKHDKHKFSATKDDRCQMHWLTKCDENEMI